MLISRVGPLNILQGHLTDGGVDLILRYSDRGRVYD